MKKLSVIIPSRNERFLSETVDDIFNKATGDFEVIVILDEKDQELKERKGLRVLKKKGSPGLRSAINQAVDAANGKYIMKTDAHCMFAEGFDEVLKADCEDNWVVIPRRYSLLPEEWKRNFSRPIIDYEYITFPYLSPNTSVRLGGKWYERGEDRKELMLDDNMTFQGSCWFSTKDHYNRINGLMTGKQDDFVLEAEELSLKTWLTDGKVMVNKRTWYAHLHKGKTWGRGYLLNSKHMKDFRMEHIDYWFNNRWPKATKKLGWLVEYFWPVRTWPEDWRDPKYEKYYKESNNL